MANRNFANSRIYTGHVMPVLIDCNFIVDSTNGNGLGIRSLKGPYVKAVYMHTSATPAAGNPNPTAGTIIVQLQDNYSRYYGGFNGMVSPVGTPSTSTTAHAPQFITSLGTASLAQWQAVGFPSNQTPTVGASFIPTASALIGGSASVSSPLSTGSGIDHIEAVGDANQTLAPSDASGATLIFQCFEANAVTQPADGTVISLAMYLSNSSILIQGE